MSYAMEVITLLEENEGGLSAGQIADRLGVSEERAALHVSKARTLLEDMGRSQFIPWKPKVRRFGPDVYRLTETMTDKELEVSEKMIVQGCNVILRGTKMIRTHVKKTGTQGKQWQKAATRLGYLEAIEDSVKALREHMRYAA